MSRTTFNLAYYCRKSKANKSNLAPLELSININGERKFINLPIKLNVDDYNKKHRPAEMNSLIREFDNKVNEVISQMLANNVPITTDTLREALKTGGVQPYSVKKCCEDFLAINKKRVGISITAKAFRKYELTRDLLYTAISPDAEITGVTPAVIEGLWNDICAKFDMTTAVGYLTKLKTIIGFAMDNGKLTINPFMNIKAKRPKKKIEYLTEEEVNTILTHTFSTPALQRIADCFLIQVFSGLAFSDLEALKKEDIKKTDEACYIQKRRIKTDSEFISVLLPEAIPILEKYDYKLPIISNQKTNSTLKVIAIECGIKTKMTTHLGRKTYGSMLLNRGVRMETVSKCLGHSSLKTTERYYAQMHKETIIKEVSQVF